MSFHEKSNAAMLVILLAVYGWYFGTSAEYLFGDTLEPEAVLALTNVKMLVTVGIIIVTSIVAHVAIAVAAPSEADDTADERDKLIGMRGDYRGGLVLGLFAVTAMGSAMLAQPHFVTANLILAGLVASELVKVLSSLIDYRRGI